MRDKSEILLRHLPGWFDIFCLLFSIAIDIGEFRIALCWWTLRWHRSSKIRICHRSTISILKHQKQVVQELFGGVLMSLLTLSPDKEIMTRLLSMRPTKSNQYRPLNSSECPDLSPETRVLLFLHGVTPRITRNCHKLTTPISYPGI